MTADQRLSSLPQDGPPDAVRSSGLVHKHLLVPSSPEAPLVLMVHGRAGSSESMWLFRRAIPSGCHIFAPQAPYPDPIGGYSWWQVEKRRVDYPVAERSAEQLASFYNKALDHYELAPKRTIAIGFSQGGAILSLAAQSGVLPLDGLALLASFVVKPKEPRTLSLPRVFWAHGTVDETIPIKQARSDVAYLRNLGGTVQYVEEPVGHKIGAKSMRQLGEWCTDSLIALDP